MQRFRGEFQMISKIYASLNQQWSQLICIAEESMSWIVNDKEREENHDFKRLGLNQVVAVILLRFSGGNVNGWDC